MEDVLPAHTPFVYFLFGMVAMACVVIGLYFFKFYMRTKDRLLAYFGVGFWLLAIERLILALSAHEGEARSLIYIIRLIAYALIIYGIVEKNRGPKPFRGS